MPDLTESPWAEIVEFVRDPLLRIALIVVFAFVVARLAGAFVRGIVKALMDREASEGTAQELSAVEIKKRMDTLSELGTNVIRVFVVLIAGVMVLGELNLDIGPAIAGLGVVGIAVGFGAQSLIKDLFAGLLILIEDQYRVGDSVKVGEISGTVENLTMRATFIRGLEGALTVIPNGAISTVSNLSRDWSRAVIDVEVDYHENLERVMTLMLDTARAMRAEQPHELIDEPTMLGIDRLTSSSMVLRMLVKTAPSRHIDIARDLRRRIKAAFDQAGIQAPPLIRLADVLKDAGTTGTNRPH